MGWEVICESCLRLAEWRRGVALVLLFVLSPAWFFYLWFVLDDCQSVRGHHTHTDSHVSVLLLTLLSYSTGESFFVLPLALILLPTKYVFGIHHLAFCHFHIQPPSLHVCHWHSPVFLNLQFYLCYTASVYFYICCFWTRTNGDRIKSSRKAFRSRS